MLGLEPAGPKEREEAKRRRKEAMKKHRKEKRENIKKAIEATLGMGMEQLTKDHIIPQSFLRKLKKDNIQLITKEKNLAKGDRLTKTGLIKILNAIIEHL